MACIKLPLETKYIFVAPVGIDEGVTVPQKKELIEQGCTFIKRLGLEPKIGILAKGRLEDKGRMAEIDDSLEIAEELTTYALSKDLNAQNFGILIEAAVKSSNFILMPDGVAGNLIFRSLYHLAGVEAIGAPVLNLDKIFIDTSRTKRSYISAIALASSLV